MNSIELSSKIYFYLCCIILTEQKVQELTEQRRLLAVGLEAIVREIQGLVSGKVEILQPSGKYRSENAIRSTKFHRLMNYLFNLCGRMGVCK